MNFSNIRFICAISLLILLTLTARHTYMQAQDKLGVYEQLDQYLQEGLVFTDENYQQVDLKSAVNMPTVLALVYYECPGICTPLMNGLADVMKKSDFLLGKDYQVFMVSFSHTEKPFLAMNKKKTYVKLVEKGDLDNSWRFFTGDSITIRRLLDNVGYQIKQEGGEYIHPATLIVLSPEGKITRYLHGTYFLPFDFKMAIIEASQGRSGPTINKVLKFCFSYDPEGQRYVLNITSISGSIILLAALIFLSYLLLTNRKKSKSSNI